MARAVHALLYTAELKTKGYEVSLLFDGAGTEWAMALLNPEHKLNPLYQKLQNAGVVQIVCDYCSNAFGVREKLQAEKIVLTAEFEGHPSLVKWLERGYVPIVL